MHATRWRRYSHRRALLPAMAALLSACSGDGTPADPQPPTLSLSLSPPNLSLEQGEGGSVGVTAVGGGSFSGAPALSIDDVPSGMTAELTDVSSSGSTTTATLEVVAGNTIRPDDYALLVTASGSGELEAEAVTVDVTGSTDPIPGNSWSVSIDDFGGAITEFFITFAADRRATRVRYTLNSVSYDYSGSEIIGGAIVSGDDADVDLSWAGNDFEFEGVMDSDRTRATGLVAFVVSEAAGSQDGFGLATMALVSDTDPPPASLYLQVAPEQPSTVPGGATEVAVSLVREEFVGEVSLEVEGLPVGVTGSFDPNPVSGEASTLSLSVDAGVAAGAYELLVRGTSTLPDVTAEITLLVEDDAVGGQVWSVSSTHFVGSISNFLITFDGDRQANRVQYTLEGVDYDYGASDVTGGATVSGSTVDINVDWSVENDLEFEGVLNEARTSAAGLFVFAIVESTAAVGGAGSATITRVDAGPPPSPALDLALSPDPVVVAQGRSVEVAVVLTRTNFSEDVTLTLEGAPAGVTGVFAENPVANGGTMLTLSVDPSVAAADYALVVRASSGLPDVTAGITLAVEEEAVGGNTWAATDVDTQLTDILITFDDDRQVIRVQYTFNGAPYDISGPELDGSAVVIGTDVNVDISWGPSGFRSDFDFDGTLAADRLSVQDGVTDFVIWVEVEGEFELAVGAGVGSSLIRQ